jgi:DNA-binding CsgD family transcriptional regulator
MQIMERMRPAREPLIAFILVLAWWLSQWGHLFYAVQLPSETFTTSPYAALVMIGFGVAIALVRVTPRWSLGLVGFLLLCQLLFWPARFSQQSWIGYLALLVFVFLLGGTPEKFPRVTIGLLVVGSLTVSLLLTLPSLSSSGEWGTINGKAWASPELVGGVLVWAAVSAGATIGCWALGRKFGSPPATESATPSGPEPGSEADPNANARILEVLSPREREVFALVARGMTNAEIAKELFIVETTVKSHVGSILVKLNATSRSELIALAYGHHSARRERNPNKSTVR